MSVLIGILYYLPRRVSSFSILVNMLPIEAALT